MDYTVDANVDDDDDVVYDYDFYDDYDDDDDDDDVVVVAVIVLLLVMVGACDDCDVYVAISFSVYCFESVFVSCQVAAFHATPHVFLRLMVH